VELTHNQKKHLYEKGYVVLRGVVPEIMVNEAKRSINRALDPIASREQLDQLRSSDILVDLYYKTPAQQLVHSVMHSEQLEPISSTQIALRFPHLREKQGRVVPHLDGIHAPGNGVKEGTIANFTALMGVLLSDLPETDAGNFMVWPGSHLKFAEYFREHGAEALLEGMPRIDWPEPPVQIIGKAGDVVLVHYLMGHTASYNYSPNIRYAAFYRLADKRIKLNWQESMTDLWKYWPGMQGFTGGEEYR
jgi:hypothetical protein